MHISLKVVRFIDFFDCFVMALVSNQLIFKFMFISFDFSFNLIKMSIIY